MQVAVCMPSVQAVAVCRRRNCRGGSVRVSPPRLLSGSQHTPPCVRGTNSVWTTYDDPLYINSSRLQKLGSHAMLFTSTQDRSQWLIRRHCHRSNARIASSVSGFRCKWPVRAKAPLDISTESNVLCSLVLVIVTFATQHRSDTCLALLLQWEV